MGERNVKLRVTVAAGEIKVDEIVEGATAEAIVTKIQQRVAQEAGFIVGGFIRRMTPLQFAQEATKRYNAAANDTAPLPATCDDFVKLGQEKGFATLLEE
jgi:hypothetical protein